VRTGSTAADFGDLTQDTYGGMDGASNCQVALFMCGVIAPAPTNTYTDQIERVVLSTNSNSTTFGNTVTARNDVAAYGNSTRAFCMGGIRSGSQTSDLETKCFVNDSTTVEFQNLGVENSILGAIRFVCNEHVGMRCGGGNGSPDVTDVLERLCLASLSTASSFGNMSTARTDVAGASSQTTALLIKGGTTATVQITQSEYFFYADGSSSKQFASTTGAKTGMAAYGAS
jgi:hypothetical protein